MSACPVLCGDPPRPESANTIEELPGQLDGRWYAACTGAAEIGTLRVTQRGFSNRGLRVSSSIRTEDAVLHELRFAYADIADVPART